MTQGKWRRLSLVLTLAVACNGSPRSAERNDAPRDSHADIANPAQPDKASAQPDKTGALVVEVDGVALKDIKGWYRYGLLTLYTGEDPNNEPGQAVRFWSMPDAPNGQVVRYPGDASGVRGGRMTYEQKLGSDRSGSKELEGAHYELALGKEEGYAVAVTIDAQADAPVRVRARGTITALTRGIKLVGGEVDRSYDHLDTIDYLTRAWIEKHHAAKQFAEHPDHCVITRPGPSAGSTPPPFAACAYVFRDDKGVVGIAKLRLEKRDGRWVEVDEVKPNQLLGAHPIRPPRPEPPSVLEPIALQRFEQKVYAPAGGFQHMREPTFVSCAGGLRPDDQPRCEIRYAVNRDKRDLTETSQLGCEFTTYLFERDAGGAFGISRTLDTSQKYDPRSHQVVPRVPSGECQKKSK
jgi:hypothetical protein